MNYEETVFSQIITRKIPADIVFENERIIIIKSNQPHAPVHLLGITKKPFENLHELLQDKENKDLLWELFASLAAEATKRGLDQKGYKLTTNIGTDAGQSIMHLHVHLLGGKKLQE
jgi:histidine triad (HIT) family protein